MAEVTVKGSGMTPSIEWIKQRYGDAAWELMLGMLDEDEAAQLRMLNPTLAYPIKTLDDVMIVFAQTQFPGDRDGADHAFRDMGHHAAAIGLSGIYSAFLKLSSPSATFKRAAPMLTSIYTGVTGEAELNDQAAGESAGTLTIHGLGGLSYAGPRLCGFGEEALLRAGATDVRIEERSWVAGMAKADPLVFDATWKT